ncbi:MAG: sensor domain-containing diguanylate cyclase [Candidatus Dadabacteria bacterium]|nr:sensor domain-containing diguanylate cyclase [Candidatus Dadabacteria bacterium]
MNSDYDNVRNGGMRFHDEEVERYRALLEYGVLDTAPEEAFDEISRLAAYICKTPIALITFVDEGREWFKSVTGLDTDVAEVPRDKSFGAYVINNQGDFLSISNPLEDDRTKRNPFLNRLKDINFIAGVPLTDDAGHKLGSLSVMGFTPKELSSEQISMLHSIARTVVLQLEKGRNAAEERERRHETGLRVAPASGDLQNNGSVKEKEREYLAPAPDSTVLKAEVGTGDLPAGADEEGPEAIRNEIRDRLGDLEVQNKKLLLLCEMDELLQASRTEEEVYTIIAHYSKLLFPGGSGGLFVFNDILTLLECVTSWGEIKSQREFLPDKCWALRLARVHISNSLSRELYCQHLDHSESVDYFCAPLVARGRALGLLYIEQGGVSGNEADTRARNTYDQHIAATAAKLSALSLANIQHHESLKNFAIYDSLTGLFNRRYMEETLKREISRVTRNKEPLGLIMIDIDHFKQFNDTYGHTAGDMLLKSIGDFFRDGIRREDIACRYGGEEFVLILPGSSLENTFRRAEQLHDEIKRVRVRHRGGFISSVQVSMGVVVFSEHGNSAELLLESADKALYKAKSLGRNRIVVA